MPNVADYIEQHRERIVQRYAEEVSRIPAAQALSHFEKIDTLSEYLSTLATISRAGKREHPEQTARRLEETHIGLRLRLGFKQEETIGEYAMLSRLITGLWERRPLAEQPYPADVQLLFEELQAAMDHVVIVYTGYCIDERQAEKLYLRRLDAAAASLMGEFGTALAVRDRLQPLVDIVQEAMEADGAALFLADETGNKLLLACTSGRAAESAEPVLATQPEFVARIARCDEAVYLPDAGNAQTPVSAPLRQCGLRSLLGLRLYPHGKTLGVLYVGVDRIELFSPRARRYFQMLIDYLSGIVERASLIAESERAKLHFQLLLDSAADGIYGMDYEGRCTFANPACVRMLGYASSEELVGKPMHELTHHTRADGTPYPKEECPLATAGRTGTAARLEGERIWRADGSSFLAELQVAPIQQEGQPAAAVVTFTDVTARLQAEQEREELLRQTQRAVSAREEIVRIVSHDLRSPLSAVLIASNLLLRDVPPDEQGRLARRNIGLIQRSADRMHQLIDDLTDFGSIEAGRLAVILESNDPAAIVGEAGEAFRQAASEKGLALHKALPDGLPPLDCDRRRILQVLENLISNAIKITPPGGALTVAAQADTEAVRFSVRDTGPGIAADELPHLFDRYWRSQRAGYKGTGLGLAIARGIVEAHRGRIWAESRLGEGSTFYFTIPLTAQ